MPRLKLTLAYDGTDYVGWQVQLNGPSVQARLERALAELLGQPVTVEAAGRTDSGVHAAGQVVAFDAPAQLPERAYRLGLNSLLPADIAVVAVEEVAPGFDPRRWARGKRYRYLISNRRSRSPLLRRDHWEIYQPLDVEAMRQALPQLLGKHDYSAFRAADCQAAHARRELTRLELQGAAGDVLALAVEGTAFLKHMVRNLVGTLVEVGRGKHPPAWVGEVLRSRDRGQAGPTAPPHGLCLEAVFFGPGPREDASDS